MGRRGVKIAVLLVVVSATLWGAAISSGISLLVRRHEAYAGTEYLMRCFYVCAAGIAGTEHRFVTLADMLRFKCARWRQ
jgi:hypothetical protein